MVKFNEIPDDELEELPSNLLQPPTRKSPQAPPVTETRHKQLLLRGEIEQKRRALKTPEGMPVMISYDHIQRHFRGSGVLGASIDKWDGPEDMLADERVWDSLKEAVSKLSPKIKPGETYRATYDCHEAVGYEGVVHMDQLPKDAKVIMENREGYYINVTDAKPPRTNRIQFMLLRDLNNPAQFLLHSVWSGSVEAPRGSLKNPDWKNFAFYSENV